MKVLAMSTMVAVTWVLAGGVRAQGNNPCSNKETAIETRECYSREQTRVNADADKLAASLAADMRKQAGDSTLGAAASDLLRKGAAAVLQSQTTWKSYRDQHCQAVAFSFTTGSGAGTAHESCLLQLAQARLTELKGAFNHPDAK
jgi:uncharacterized protein YecT (DUF1311 family)